MRAVNTAASGHRIAAATTQRASDNCVTPSCLQRGLSISGAAHKYRAMRVGYLLLVTILVVLRWGGLRPAAAPDQELLSLFGSSHRSKALDCRVSATSSSDIRTLPRYSSLARRRMAESAGMGRRNDRRNRHSSKQLSPVAQSAGGTPYLDRAKNSSKQNWLMATACVRSWRVRLAARSKVSPRSPLNCRPEMPSATKMAPRAMAPLPWSIPSYAAKY